MWCERAVCRRWHVNVSVVYWHHARLFSSSSFMRRAPNSFHASSPEPRLCAPCPPNRLTTDTTGSESASSFKAQAGVVTLEDGAPAEINTNTSGSQMWKRNLPQVQNKDVTDISTCFHTRSLLALPPADSRYFSSSSSSSSWSPWRPLLVSSRRSFSPLIKSGSTSGRRRLFAVMGAL